MKPLDLKYSMSVLLSISERGQCFKKDLYGVVSSPNTLDKLLEDLRREKLIEIREEMRGRRTYYITLTPKGKQVARKLKEIDLMLRR